MKLMHRKRTIAAVGVMALAVTLLATTPAHAAAPDCRTSASSEIDAHGYITMYPRVTCNDDTVTLVIYSSGVAPAEVVRYENRPAGSYPGIGISLPYTGPGDYCMVIDAVWTWVGATYTANTQSRHCFYRT